MKTLVSVLLVVGLVAMSGCSSGIGGSTDMISILTTLLGVNQSQAVAGAGSLLGLASQKLGPQDFAKIASAVPGTNDLIKQAGGLTGLGANFGSMATVTSALGKMGVVPDQVSKMSTSMADFIGKAGGTTTKDLFLSALK